jgi:hypothetical protein
LPLRGAGMLEEMTLENENLRIRILPELGGKIASFFLKPAAFELAAQSTHGDFRKAHIYDSFADFDMSGMDDAFPNIDPETLVYDGRIIRYPDHGEIWSSVFEVMGQGEQTLALRHESQNFPYIYEKSFRLSGNELMIRRKVRNISSTAFPCIFTLHALMHLEPDMQIVYPAGIRHMENVLPGTLLGDAGRIYPYPDGKIDFHSLPKTGGPYMLKYYGVEKAAGGICGFDYPAQKVRCRIRYDAAVLPYIGTWITCGGFMNDYNLALEMTDGYYDKVSRALRNGKIRILSPKEEVTYDTAISLEEDSSVN